MSRVGNDAVCDAATAGIDARATLPAAQSYITVPIGTTPKFYLLTTQTTGGMGYVFFLDERFGVLRVAGGS